MSSARNCDIRWYPNRERQPGHVVKYFYPEIFHGRVFMIKDWKPMTEVEARSWKKVCNKSWWLGVMYAIRVGMRHVLLVILSKSCLTAVYLRGKPPIIWVESLSLIRHCVSRSLPHYRFLNSSGMAINGQYPYRSSISRISCMGFSCERHRAQLVVVWALRSHPCLLPIQRGQWTEEPYKDNYFTPYCRFTRLCLTTIQVIKMQRSTTFWGIF